MGTRAANERKFGNWVELRDGGRRYWSTLSVKWVGGRGKEVDGRESTVRFWQEIYDDKGVHVEIHQKYPVDLGHQKI
jgi:hypothetical protein